MRIYNGTIPLAAVALVGDMALRSLKSTEDSSLLAQSDLAGRVILATTRTPMFDARRA